MARFFFDVRRDGRRTGGDVGIDLPDEAAVWPEVARLIVDCVHAAPDGPRVFDVVVTDERGAIVLRSTTALPPEWPTGRRATDGPGRDALDRPGSVRHRSRAPR